MTEFTAEETRVSRYTVSTIMGALDESLRDVESALPAGSLDEQALLAAIVFNGKSIREAGNQVADAINRLAVAVEALQENNGKTEE